MKKYTVKHLITSALLSLTALVVGYALLSLPFRLMDWLDPTQMKLVFAAEFVLYITVLGLVITRRERNWLPKKPPMPADSAAAPGWHGKTPPPAAWFPPPLQTPTTLPLKTKYAIIGLYKNRSIFLPKEQAYGTYQPQTHHRNRPLLGAPDPHGS